ncbi:MAG: NifB/NifX family molybdenum-iron cluster-binding protein [Methanocellales archaeon]|nr:NifB/NifX family molybdenum-iron cluster-binding protein [Methanocellales archaeon]
MKIVVATTVGGLDDTVSLVFGRCPTFTVVNVEGKKIKNSSVIRNQYAGAMGGAGIQAAQLVVNQGAKAVIAGNYGPNASMVFNQAGVEIVSAQGISVRDAVKKYLEGELPPITAATMPMFGGMGMGVGRRRGGGGRMGMGFMQQAPTPPPIMPPMPQVPKGQELQMLETQIKTFEQQLDQIKKRLEELRK